MKPLSPISLISTILCLLLCFSSSLFAQPDFQHRPSYHDIGMYQDMKDSTIAYYVPGKIALVKDARGKPDFQFLRTRYFGSRKTGDRDKVKYNSFVSFQIKLSQPSSTQLTEAREAHPQITELRPLPLQKVEARLVFTPVEKLSTQSDPIILRGGSELRKGGEGEIWSHRFFSLRLDQYNSQFLWKAIKENTVLVSVAYAYYAWGIPSREVYEASYQDSLPPGLAAIIEKQFPSTTDTSKTRPELVSQLISSGAVPIRIDLDHYPGLLKQLELLPGKLPSKGVIQVYCYDFNNELRSDLVQKEVRIVADGRGGQKVRTSASFVYLKPEEFVVNLELPTPVLMERPYAYQVIEHYHEGKPRYSIWKKGSWTGILDITTLE